MDDATIVFVSVGGAILGFILSHLLLLHRDKKRLEREANALRTLINLEILDNLKHLHLYWEKLLVSEASDTSRPYPAIPQPLPPWGSKMWESRIDLLPVALTDAELRKIFKFYKDIKYINDHLITLAQSQAALSFLEGSDVSDELQIIQTHLDTEEIWKQCKWRIKKTLKEEFVL